MRRTPPSSLGTLPEFFMRYRKLFIEALIAYVLMSKGIRVIQEQVYGISELFHLIFR